MNLPGLMTSHLTFLGLVVALKSGHSKELTVDQSESNFSLHEGRGDGQPTWVRSEARVANEDIGPALFKKGCFLSCVPALWHGRTVRFALNKGSP